MKLKQGATPFFTQVLVFKNTISTTYDVVDLSSPNDERWLKADSRRFNIIRFWAIVEQEGREKLALSFMGMYNKGKEPS